MRVVIPSRIGQLLNSDFVRAEDARVRLLVGYAVLGLLGVGLYPLVSNRAVPYTVWYAAFGVAATLVVVTAAAVRRRGNATSSWLVLGAGLGLFAIGDLVYLVYAVAGQEMPWPVPRRLPVPRAATR